MPLANPSLIALATGQRGLRHRLLPLRDCFGATSAPCSYRIPDDSIAPWHCGRPMPVRLMLVCRGGSLVRRFGKFYFLPFSFSFVIALLNSVVSR
jgi:hypothetical protein